MSERLSHFDADLIICPWCGHNYNNSKERFTDKGKPFHGHCPCEHCDRVFHWQTKWCEDNGKIDFDTATWHFINYGLYNSISVTSITLNIESVENGYILKNSGIKGDVKVAISPNQLKHQISLIIDKELKTTPAPERNCPAYRLWGK